MHRIIPSLHCSLSSTPPSLCSRALSKPLTSAIHTLCQLQNILVQQPQSIQNIPYVECSLVTCDFMKLLAAPFAKEGMSSTTRSHVPGLFLVLKHFPGNLKAQTCVDTCLSNGKRAVDCLKSPLSAGVKKMSRH